MFQQHVVFLKVSSFAELRPHKHVSFSRVLELSFYMDENHLGALRLGHNIKIELQDTALSIDVFEIGNVATTFYVCESDDIQV